MKFIKETTNKGIHIPAAALKLCGFSGGEGEKVELHAGADALVVLKGRMNAMELIRAAQQLQELSAQLSTHLAKVCGYCDGCSGDGCPLAGWEEPDITLPDYLREEAGIPEDAKLCAYVDEEDGTVTIAAADHDYDLRDVPPMFMEMFTAANVCIGELEERLIAGDRVYGG